MKALNCYDVDTTYMSLESILGISKNGLRDFLESYDIERQFNLADNDDLTPDRLILHNVCKEFDVKSVQFDYTHWFHLTRTYPNNNFSDGILPLNQAEDIIWQYLFDLQVGNLDRVQWDNFRQSEIRKWTNNSFIYNHKMQTSDFGPYAMLVRDIAFNAHKVGNHDYLDIPEIVQDICRVYSPLYKFDLLNTFRNATSPCIVQFKHMSTNKRWLGVALYYLYCVLCRNKLSLHCNTCFKSEGMSIPPSDILTVEFI